MVILLTGLCTLIGGIAILLLGKLLDKQTDVSKILTSIQVNIAEISVIAENMQKQQDHHSIRLDDHEKRLSVLEQE